MMFCKKYFYLYFYSFRSSLTHHEIHDAAARARSDHFKTNRDFDLVAALPMGKQVVVV